MRRNRLSDFRNVRASGLIAMKLEEGDRLIGVATCREADDVLLATRLGRCIRFQVTDDTLRVFAGRDSQGVRGIRLSKGDEVMSLSVLRHVDAGNDERAAYLKHAAAKRRTNGDEVEAEIAEPDEAVPEATQVDPTLADIPPNDAVQADVPPTDVTLSAERIRELEDAEEILLTVTNAGFGKRTSAYEYRVSGRGGQGIANITLAPRNGTAVAATFPVRPGDGVMLVTDAGRLIRVPADQVRITGRQVMGVTLFRVDADEHVTSVFPVVEDAAEDAAEDTTEDGADG